MRAPALLLARILLVAGPIVIAFRAGGFFSGPRDVALAGAAAALALVALAGERPGRRARVRVALVAVWGYAGWIALSSTWAPVPVLAGDDAERALLYAAALTAAAGAFADRAAMRALEPLAAAGTLIVVGYGLSGRLLAGIVTQHPQLSAVGRFDQPLTYWNAMGALAAIGVVLCARLAGDAARSPALRLTAAAATVPLGMGCYLSFSRGALAALAAGLTTLVVLAPTRAQVRAAGVTALGVVAGAVAGTATGSVRALAGTLSARERDGAIVLGVMVVAMAAVALLARALAADDGPAGLPRRAPVVAAVIVVSLLIVPLVAASGHQDAPAGNGANNSRLASVGSNRYAYWRVALDTAADHPVAGIGASGFRVAWLRHRHIDEVVRDAHSLEIETLAELGAVGLALLAAMLAGIALAARLSHGAAGPLVAGPIAAIVVWAFHSSIDWDWEMPGLTLVAVVFAGAILGQADRAVTAPRRSAAPPG